MTRPRRSPFRTFRRLGRWVARGLTPGGQAMLLALLATSAGGGVLSSPLYLLASALLAVLLVSAGVGYWWRPRLAVRTAAPQVATVDQPMTVEVELTNRGPRPVHDLTVALVEGGPWSCTAAGLRRRHLACGERWAASHPLRPTRRGVHRLPQLHAWTGFPFFLLRTGGPVVLGREVIVVPEAKCADQFDLWRQAGRESSEAASARSGGRMGEYAGSREYESGMVVRRWDYASWARLGRPVVREFDHPAALSVGLLVAGGATASGFERCLAWARGLADQVDRQGGLLAWLGLPTGATDLAATPAHQRRLVLDRSIALAQPTSGPARWRWPPEVSLDLMLVVAEVWTEELTQYCRGASEAGVAITRIMVGNEVAEGQMLLEGR